MEYRFIDKDPVIDLLRTAIYNHGNGRSLATIAVAAHLAPSTLTNLLYGKTKRPQHRTVQLICDALDISLRYYDRDDRQIKAMREIWRHFVKRHKHTPAKVIPLRRKA